MTGRSTWRSLTSVMLVTLHVAVISTVIRSIAGSTGRAGFLALWVPVAIVLGSFLSWPIGRAIAGAFQPVEFPADGRCPRCGRTPVRPLIRPGAGLFPEEVGYRCARCMTTFRVAEGGFLEEPPPADPARESAAGIDFLPEISPGPAEDPEIRFLDGPS